MMNYETMKTQLTGDYRAVFDRAQTYLMTSQFSAQYGDDKMMELYDLLLTAQTEQKPAEQVAGKDHAAFVQNFFSDYQTGWQERLHGLTEALKRLSAVVLVILLAEFFTREHSETDFFAHRTDVSMLLAGLLGGLVFIAVNQFVLRPASLKAKKIRNTGWSFIVIGVFVALIVLELIFLRDMKLDVPTAPLVFAFGAYLLGYYIVRSVWRLKKTGTVRDIHKEQANDSYYKELRDRDIDRVLMTGMLKHYQRLARKGKITEDAFLAKMEREEKLTVYINRFASVLMAAVVLYWIVRVALESTVAATLIFAVICGVLEWLIWKLFVGSSIKVSESRRHIYTECRKSGMTLPVYLESQIGGS